MAFSSIVDNLMIEMRENLIEFVGVLISSGMVTILHASFATQNLLDKHGVTELGKGVGKGIRHQWR